MKKVRDAVFFGIMMAFLGAVAGAIVWICLRIINVCTDFVWDKIPGYFGIEGTSSIIFNLIVCLIGAVVIGLFQKKFGILPHETEEVLGILHKEGTYPYNRIHVIAIAAVIPLVFGGTLGPEAGLVGVIVGLCCWIGDSMKKRGDQYMALAETGASAVLAVVFGAPLMGIVGQLEPGAGGEKYRERILQKKGRIIMYFIGVAGAFAAYKGLSALFGSGGGIPRFERKIHFEVSYLKWVIPLIAAGVVFAFLYKVFEHITLKVAEKFEKHRVISCMIPAVLLACGGVISPYAMFSGEHQLEDLISGWQGMAVSFLVIAGISKIFLVNACISFGWRGGSIFPIIFGGVSMGYAFALLTGIDGTFAVAIFVAAAYAYINRKPATTAAILLLCFPVTYLIPIIITALATSKIPSPWVKKEVVEEK